MKPLIRLRHRHGRRAQFAEAIASVGEGFRGPWTSIDPDPNAARVLAHRASSLREAWRSPVTNRIAYLQDMCRGCHVLDIGCVAHDVARMHRSEWLHGRLAEAADTCIGLDVLDDGIELMNSHGFRGVTHDITQGSSGLEEHIPADVVVAGEVIEHLDDPSALIRFANDVLIPGGRLVVTTPNPYAPERVWAGQRGCVWENVDHVAYLFPSGMVAMAERHGMRLVEARTVVTGRQTRLDVHRLAATVKRYVRASGWQQTGIASTGRIRPVRVGRSPSGIGLAVHRSTRPFVGETFIYVLEKLTIDGESLVDRASSE